MNWKTIFNPYEKIADKILLLLGLVTFALGIFIYYSKQTIHDGILDVHLYPNISFTVASTSIMISILSITLILFAIGKFVNPKTRMIDILNTGFISRIPFYFAPFIANSSLMVDATNKIMEDPLNYQPEVSEIIPMFGFSAILILLLIYSILLIVTGFKTATNAKTWKHYLLLGMGIIIAEVLSKLIISQFLPM